MGRNNDISPCSPDFWDSPVLRKEKYIVFLTQSGKLIINQLNQYTNGSKRLCSN